MRDLPLVPEAAGIILPVAREVRDELLAISDEVAEQISGVPITVNGRYTRTLGMAYSGKRHVKGRRIELARVLALPENRDLLVEVVRHEFGHIMTPGAGHGPRWKRWARVFGYRPRAKYAMPVSVERIVSRLRFTCSECGTTSYCAPRTFREAGGTGSNNLWCPKCITALKPDTALAYAEPVEVTL